MATRVWRFLTVMLTALSMATALCHLLEMPAKTTYGGALWLVLRDQWEHTHAARAIPQVVALGLLVVSILVEVPARAPAT